METLGWVAQGLLICSASVCQGLINIDIDDTYNDSGPEIFYMSLWELVSDF